MVELPDPPSANVYLNGNGQWASGPAGTGGYTHFVRVRVANNSLNASVANNAVLSFDTIDSDTDSYASTSLPINRVTVPAGLGGLYVLVSAASSTGTQATTLGVGFMINGTLTLSQANEWITGPGSVNYAFTKTPVQIGYLSAGDYIQLYNTSTSAGPNAFTNTFMALARLDVGGPPGATGPIGPSGPTGSTGLPAWTLTTAGFTVPAIGSSVTVNVNDTSWVALGEILWIQDATSPGVAGPMQVTAKTSNSLTFLNIAVSTFPQESLGAHIEAPTAKTYTVDLAASSLYTIKSFDCILGAGTCTLALVQNGTNVAGASAIALSTTLSTTPLSQAVALNDKIQITLSSISSATDLQFTMWIQR